MPVPVEADVAPGGGGRRRRRGGDSQRSLFGEILDWMLAPLLFVWPVSIAITHYFANSVAAYPYDQSLREHVNVVTRQIKFVDGKPVVNLPLSARAILRADEVDSVYFHVINRQGQRIVGDPELPLPDDPATMAGEQGEIQFRDTEVGGQDLRVAYSVLGDPGVPRDKWLIVEVGETLEKRSQLANKIIASVILPQFIIIPLAVVLVWFGLSQGLRPLTWLRERIEARAEDDLSPIPNRRVPEELRPLIEAFNAMMERVQRNLEVQTRFIADAAHQLRTPLAGLKAQVQLALRENDAEQVRHALAQIDFSVDRASHLVNQLLALARAEGVTGDAGQVEVDLNQLLKECASEWVFAALEKHIDLGFEDAGAPVLIRGYPFWLRELINNLVDNALRYTPADGRVTCRVRRELGEGSAADRVVLEVEDNGIGIRPEECELVFERFYRSEEVTGGVVDSKGSGLGLPIVREIATLHDAVARLVPNPLERGTVASVSFPLHRPEAPVAPPPPPNPIMSGVA
ncbi:two-component system, OmpR family, sensor histidine kinase [Oryzomicrobium terrae]|uniref:histidine kinase n=2 Tax=Oryzomicrobium terrae TaxID=1735038 RepID=A0A5C1EDD4_9RHOO|nr:two-component system, OmpR family, sensor histidine kinase [Oryzomicrobium terrae]